jgi:hypothetical protein
MKTLRLNTKLTYERRLCRVVAGSDGLHWWWQAGADRVELRPARTGVGWDAIVVRSAWGGPDLKVDGRFTELSEAIVWCERTAVVLARDSDDE